MASIILVGALRWDILTGADVKFHIRRYALIRFTAILCDGKHINKVNLSNI